jgi:hypothetical protein
MGVSLSIGLYAETNKLPDVSAALYRRLLERGTFQKATIHKGHVDHNLEPTHTELSLENLHMLTQEIYLASPNKALFVDMSYPLTSGRWLNIWVEFYGSQFVHGFYSRQYGPIRVTCSLSDLRSTTQEKLATNEIPTSFTERVAWQGENEDQEVIEVLRMLHNQSVEEERLNAREFFFAVCGLLENKQSKTSLGHAGGIDHAAMYTDLHYPSAVLNSGIFHRDIREYARDFVRIFLEYNRGIFLPMTLKQVPDLWNLQPLELPPMLKKGEWGVGIPAKEYYPYTTFNNFSFNNPGGNKIIKFLNGLTEEKVIVLSALSAPKIEELLYELIGSEDIPGIDVYEFGTDGMALLTTPVSSLWRAYYYILQQSS